MTENILKIQTDRSLSEVWDFITDSRNVSKWFDSIAEEIPNESPWRKGTILKSRAPGSDTWNEYEITDYELNKKFVLSQLGGGL